MTRENGTQGNSARQFIDGLPKTTDPGPLGHVWRECGRVDLVILFQRHQGAEAFALSCRRVWRGATQHMKGRELGEFLISSQWRHDPGRDAVILGQWIPEEEPGDYESL